MKTKLFLALGLIVVMAFSVSAAVTTYDGYGEESAGNSEDSDHSGYTYEYWSWDFEKPKVKNTHDKPTSSHEDEENDEDEDHSHSYSYYNKEYCSNGWCYTRYCYGSKCEKYYSYTPKYSKYYRYDSRYYYDDFGYRSYNLYPWFSEKIDSIYYYTPSRSSGEYRYGWDGVSTYN
jgi:hypothetical protein